jgi:hypothetical protein
MAPQFPPLRRAMATQAGLSFIAGFLEACGLIALFGAAAGGLGYLAAGFWSRFAPAAVLMVLIFIREEPS